MKIASRRAHSRARRSDLGRECRLELSWPSAGRNKFQFVFGSSGRPADELIGRYRFAGRSPPGSCHLLLLLLLLLPAHTCVPDEQPAEEAPSSRPPVGRTREKRLRRASDGGNRWPSPWTCCWRPVTKSRLDPANRWPEPEREGEELSSGATRFGCSSEIQMNEWVKYQIGHRLIGGHLSD